MKADALIPAALPIPTGRRPESEFWGTDTCLTQASSESSQHGDLNFGYVGKDVNGLFPHIYRLRKGG